MRMESQGSVILIRPRLSICLHGCASGTSTRIALPTRTMSLENFSFPTFRIASLRGLSPSTFTRSGVLASFGTSKLTRRSGCP